MVNDLNTSEFENGLFTESFSLIIIDFVINITTISLSLRQKQNSFWSENETN